MHDVLLIAPLYLISLASLYLLVRISMPAKNKPPADKADVSRQPKPLNGKTVYLTADHERKIAARMSQGSETPHEDIW